MNGPHELEWFRCAPLSAKLTEPACQRNKRRAKAMPKGLRGAYEACLKCPGVRALDDRPNVIDAAAVVARAKAAKPQRQAHAGSPMRHRIGQSAFHRPHRGTPSW